MFVLNLQEKILILILILFTMFYLIGLGLDLNSISAEALKICEKSDKIYLESYTVDFPYDTKKLEEVVGKKIEVLKREPVENEKFLDEAKTKEVVLLVYGNPLMATTHISLILKCNEEKIKYSVLHNASILDAVGETGLQVYKFGRIASMPTWTDKYRPGSFIDLVLENKKIKSHSLILVDIGLDFEKALAQLEEASEGKIKLEKIIICSRMGTKEGKFFYDTISNLKKKKISKPFCFIIPGELHFIEEEAIEKLSL